MYMVNSDARVLENILFRKGFAENKRVNVLICCKVLKVQIFSGFYYDAKTQVLHIPSMDFGIDKKLADANHVPLVPSVPIHPLSIHLCTTKY
jgi:hypothetical protein